MVVMCMSDDDPVRMIMRQRPEVWQRIETHLLRMHACIQHDAVISAFEQIRVRADLAAAGEVTESHVDEASGKKERETRP